MMAVYLSPVSRYFFDKLRTDCHRRGIHLHVLPSPISAERRGQGYVDPLGIYDGPIINDIPADQLMDGTHFKRSSVAAARRRVLELYHLDFAGNP